MWVLNQEMVLFPDRNISTFQQSCNWAEEDPEGQSFEF